MSRGSVRWIFVGLTLLGAGVVLGLWMVTGVPPDGWGFPGSAAAWALGFVALGSVIERSKPAHPVGRRMLWVGPLAMLFQLAIDLSRLDAPWVAYLTPLGGSFMLFLSVMIHALALFPDGDWAFRWARQTVAVMWVAAIGGLTLLVLGDPTGLVEGQPNPYQVVSIPEIGEWTLLIWNLTTAAVLIGLVWAFFRSSGAYRRQFGWVILAGSVTVTFALLAAVLDGCSGQCETEGVAAIFEAVAAASVLTIPAAMTVAVLKYRLYEIDRLMSRTISYGIVIGLMIAVYVGLVAFLQGLLPAQEDLTVALSTLAAVALSFPLLRRVRRWVDRRFFRSRYDSAQVVARVADDLRTTVDLEEVEARTEAVIEEVFAPEEVTVWLAGRTTP